MGSHDHPVDGCAVVLLSGGQDSATAAAWAQRRYSRVVGLTVDYGQVHRPELAAAGAVSRILGLDEWAIATVQVALTGTLVGEGPSAMQSHEGFNKAFVPGRNLVLLSLALGYAARQGARAIVMGACAADAAGFPDCREPFLRAARRAMSLAVADDLILHAPFVTKSKADLVRLARTLPRCWEALAETWTCYRPGVRPRTPTAVPCGACTACIARAQGFAEAGERDPAIPAVSLPVVT